MTAEFDALRARLEPDPAVHAVIFCLRPVHAEAHVIGSTIERCYLCQRPIWVSPSSSKIAAEPRSGDVYFVCCCCAELHSPEDYLHASRSGMEIHTHHWGAFATCPCGMSKAEWDREVPR